MRFAGASTVVSILILAIVPPALGISKIEQGSLPADLRSFEAAVLDSNPTFITLMTERSVRVVSTDEATIVTRDVEGDKDFIRDHRNENGDYWYWTHQTAREALILALGNQPEEAIRVIDTVPYNEALAPEYRWIVTPEFREYLSKARQDLAYYYDTYLGVSIFFTNYQVSQLEEEYPSVRTEEGEGRGRGVRAQVPILEVNLEDLMATSREEGKAVGLDAILGIDPEGITDSLLPSSPDFGKRQPRLQERLITASDVSLKRIPVPTREIRDLLEKHLQGDQPFLRIEGTMRSDGSGTRFSEDLRVVVESNSARGQFLSMHRLALGGAEVKKAQ